MRPSFSFGAIFILVSSDFSSSHCPCERLLSCSGTEVIFWCDVLDPTVLHLNQAPRDDGAVLLLQRTATSPTCRWGDEKEVTLTEKFQKQLVGDIYIQI